MKKNLIALALAVSAVSGVAHAWTDGEFSGSVDFGGSITPDTEVQNWAWEAGTGLNNFSSYISDMTSGGTVLQITAEDNKAILLGKTKQTIAGNVGSGIIPQLSFSDGAGDTVTINRNEDNLRSGEVYFILPVTDGDSGSALGNLRVNAAVAGVVLGVTTSETSSNLFSVAGTSSNTSNAFFGGIPSGAAIQSATTAVSLTETFGALSESDLTEQVSLTYPDAVGTINYLTSAASTSFVGSVNPASAATYAMGIKSGQTMNVIFDSEVTDEVNWVAPLNISVSYY